MNFGYLRIFIYIGFVSSYLVTANNMDVAPSFSVFSEFDHMCQLNVLLV